MTSSQFSSDSSSNQSDYCFLATALPLLSSLPRHPIIDRMRMDGKCTDNEIWDCMSKACKQFLNIKLCGALVEI